MSPWLRYLIDFVVGAHGFTYIPFGLLVPGQLKTWRGTSALLGRFVSGARYQTAVIVFHVAAGITILACAVAIALAPSVPDLWRPLAITGSAAGLVGFALFFDGQAGRTVEEGGIGLANSLVLLSAAIALPGAFD